MAIHIDRDKCNGCGKCSRSCPYQAIEIHDKKAQWIEDRCTLCGACLKSCKYEALTGEIPERVVPDFSNYRDVLVFCEMFDGSFHRSAIELLGCARGLADDLSQRVIAVATGVKAPDTLRDLIAHGADECLFLENSSLAFYQTCTYAHILCEAIKRFKPSILLIAATPLGRDLAPRVARRMGLGLTADCTRLSIDPEEKILLQTRPAFGGNIMATIVSRYSRPQAATVRPGIMRPINYDATRSGDIRVEKIDLAQCTEFTRILECTMNPPTGVNLASAKIVVAGGRPICSEKGLAILKDFAAAVKGEIACTRVVVEEGFLSQEHQVGQTGQTVRPEIYFACGISGAVQHRAGIEGSRYIVAINKDPDAPIFEVADFAIVGDMFDVLPALTRAVQDQQKEFSR
jgi:electron transfer flavoprotein alpha subunit/NAD-dependent dihydropyrimidine dehydrogenase PreA subunit|uniref:Electron transfer flavoprotein subunit alpha n=1 Tax=Desulfomonile tiedjei TaxID=2358 RepID=A0A7C4EX49_9BACT